MIRLRDTIFSENIQFFFLVLCWALNSNNYFKVCLKSKYTIFCQNNCQNAQFGPFYQFTLGLSLVFVFSHRLLHYFAENIVLVFCSVFKTEIRLLLIQKNTFLYFLRTAGYNLYNQDEFTFIICHNLNEIRNSSINEISICRGTCGYCRRISL